jgi:hypothetical protein
MKYILEHRQWTEKNDLAEFMQFCKEVLEYDTDPSVKFSDDLQHAQEIGAMGYFNPETRTIWVFKGRRVRADWYRTLAHELVHHAQRERGEVLNGHTGSETENDANAKAGAVLRMWGRHNPAIFEGADSSQFINRLQLAKLGLADLDDISARSWFPMKKWKTEDYRYTWNRLNVSELLTPEDIENLDSLRSEGIVWYTDPTPGTDEAPADQFLKIVGPSSVVKEITPDIHRMFDEALHRISENPVLDKLTVEGWSELIWHMRDPQLNSSWGKEQPAIYARWKKEIGL